MAQILIVENDDLMAKMYGYLFDGRGDRIRVYPRGDILLGDLDWNGGVEYDLAIADRTLPDTNGDVIVDKLK